MTIASLLTTSLCLLSPQGPTIDVLTVAPLLTPAAPTTPAPWGTLLRRDRAGSDLINGTETALDVDTLLAILQAGAAENEPRIATEYESLVVVGRALDVQRVRERLQKLSTVLARPCRLEFAVWDTIDQETPPALLDAQQFAAFTQKRQPLWRCATTANCAGRIELERMRWSDYVRRIEGSVAQKQSITHPVIHSYGEGGHALARVHGLVGSDDVVVHLQYATGQRRGVVRALQTGMPGAADLEMPTLESYFGTASGRVANGGALAITLRGHAISGGSIVLTCQVSCALMPPEACRELGVFPIGALTSPSLMQRVDLPAPVDDNFEARADDPDCDFGRLTEERVLELVALAVEGAEVSTQGMQGHLFVTGSAEARARVESLLRGLQDQLLRNAAIHHTGTLAGDANGTAPNQSVLHELMVPTLVGREVLALRLLETTTVNRLEAMIAQEASVLDPQVTEVQSGTWLRARLLPSGDALHVEATIRSSHAPAPVTRTVMPGGGVLMPLDIASRRLTHAARTPLGKPIDHGDGPAVTIEGRGYRSVLTTTVR